MRAIVEYFAIHVGDINAIFDDLPRLSREQIGAALAYYRDQRNVTLFWL